MHMSLVLLYCAIKWHKKASFRLKYVSGAHLVGHMLNWIVLDRIILDVRMVCSKAYPRIHYLIFPFLCVSISPKYKSYPSILLTIHVLLCVVAVWYLQINCTGDKEVINIAPKPVKLPWRIWINEYQNIKYRKISNISRTLVGNKIVDHSDVVGASPVGAAPTTSSFST